MTPLSPQDLIKDVASDVEAVIAEINKKLSQNYQALSRKAVFNISDSVGRHRLDAALKSFENKGWLCSPKYVVAEGASWWEITIQLPTDFTL